MTNKKMYYSLGGIVILSILLSLVFTGFSGSAESAAKSQSGLIGTWQNIENPDSLHVTFQKNGNFQLDDVTAGNYVVNEDGTVVLNYSEENGGHATTLSYQVGDDGNTLTTHNLESGIDTHYQKIK